MIHRIIEIILQIGRDSVKPPKFFTNSILMLDTDLVLCFCLLVFSNALQDSVLQAIDLESKIKSHILSCCLENCMHQSMPLIDNQGL